MTTQLPARIRSLLPLSKSATKSTSARRPAAPAGEAAVSMASREQFNLVAEKLLRRRSRSRHVLLLLAVEQLSVVDGSLGEIAADDLAGQLGVRVSKTLPDRSVLARLRGNEFAVLLPDADEQTAGRTAREISALFDEPFTIDGVSLRLQARVGAASYPADGASTTELLRKADLASGAARRNGSFFTSYDTDLAQGEIERLRTLGELDNAIRFGQLECEYQPKLELRTGKIVSAEALVRWRHPERGLLQPDQFLPLVRDPAVMSAITGVVMQQSLAAAALWRRHGHELAVAINFAASDLCQPQLVQQLHDLVAAHGLAPESVVVEVTETEFVDAAVSEQTVFALRADGFQIAIDDYGTEYSSLERVRSLGAHELKLDKSLVTSMRLDFGTAAVVRSSIQLAHAMRMRFVAEGVEDVATMEMLAELGCDLVQGHCVAKAMPATSLLRWLGSREARPVTVS